MRNNSQVRHDRGGLTVGFFFQSKRRLDKLMQELDESTNRLHHSAHHPGDPSRDGFGEQRANTASIVANDAARFRYRAWRVAHRLQGYETRFALKMTILTTLLAVPAWLPQSRNWWNEHDAWWVVVFVWIMMHPRVSRPIK